MARILLIDDDDLLRGVLAKALTHVGHEIIQASDGKLGVDLARATQFELVITDLIMPVQEGVETIIALHKEQPNLPVIAMSGGTSNSKLYLDIAGKMGARRVLGKPFTPKQLCETIDEVLAEHNAAQERRDAG